MATCKACGDFCNGKSNKVSGDIKRRDYCHPCWEELVEGYIPNVTGPVYPPTGTGQVPWQRYGRQKTDS